MFKIGALVSGGGTNLQAILDAVELGKINGEVVSVVSNKKDAFALERAKKHNVEAVYMSRKLFKSFDEYEDALISHFKSRNVDLIILAGFMVILSAKFAEAFKNKIMNIHPSLIPSFCGKGFYGLKVHEAVLEKGVKLTGATVHFVDSTADTGPIILQKAVEVKDGDTPEILQKRVMEEAEWIIFPEAVRLFAEGKIVIDNNIVRRVD
ncbi:MAG: phosphoribosylglycinamide formyltransferase [Clostridiales bacterium]|jgi:phosphoribosylglycinamide formyltransferase-1|nr:phosphoribosylglycinamide formyltransferase [Clostridiales bacterium]